MHRLILSRCIRFMNQVLFRVRLIDANCPFRLIERQTLLDLIKEIESDALAPNIMIALLAKKAGVKVKEIPVVHHKRKTGKVSIANWRLLNICFKGLGQLLVFRTALKRKR